MTSNTEKKNSYGDTAVVLWEQKQQVIIASFCPSMWGKMRQANKMLQKCSKIKKFLIK